MLLIQPVWRDTDTKQIMQIMFHDNWTWTDYEQAHQIAYSLIAEVQHPVVNLHLPTSAASMKIAKGNGTAVIRSLVRRTPKNLVGVYIVNSTPIASMFGKIFGAMLKAIGIEVYIVDTLEKALALAEKRLNAVSAKRQAS